MKKLLLLFCSLLVLQQSFSQTYELDNNYANGTGFNGEVNTIKIDQGGKAYVGGAFTSYNGTTRNYLARLNADGTVDAGFDPSANLSATIDDIALTSSPTPFITVVTGGNIKRFYSGGGEFTGGDFLMRSTNNVIYTVAQAGTNLIFGGNFTDYDGNTVGRIGKMDSGGTPDATFIANTGTGFDGVVRTIEVTPSGKILVGGDFNTFNGVSRSKIALLNSDGTLDTNFVPAPVLANFTYAVAMQADGKVLAGKPGGSATILFRFNADGSEDTSFNNGFIPGTPSYIRDIYTNGTDDIIVAGWLDQGVAKLSYTNGIVTDIASGNGIEGSNKEVNAIAVQADGSLLMGGDFTSYNGIAASNFAKVAECGVSIDTQPATTSACETSDVSFSVVASGGSGTLTYQWQENTANGIGLYSDISNAGVYSGATTASLSLTGVTLGMTGNYYRCIITDTNCSSSSNSAMLTVTGIQSFTADPTDQTICQNESTSFTASFTGPSGSFIWQEDPGTGVFADVITTVGGIYVGAGTPNLILNNVPASMNGYKYRLKSTKCDAAGTFTLPALLTVNELPVITINPGVSGLCQTGDAEFNVEATGTGLSYQWQYKFFNTGQFQNLPEDAVFTGTNTPTLTITAVENTALPIWVNGSPNSTANFRCVISSNGCVTNSGTGILYKYDAPTITSDPVDVIGCAINVSGINTSFSIVSSTSGVTYQWQVDDGSGFVNVVDDAIYSGSNTNSLALTGATPALSGYQYRCEVGGCASPVYSAAATLTIDAPPVITVGAVQANICEGSDAVFTVEATGSNLTYQWQEYNGFSYNDISDDATFTGTTTSTLTLTAPTTNKDGFRYRCVVTNGTCTLNSSNGLLKIYAQPTLTLYFGNQTTVCDGGATTLKVNPSSFSGFNAGVFTYQWQSDAFGLGFVDIADDTNYSGTTTRTLSIDVAPFSFNGNKYRCVIVGCTTGNTSPEETLTVIQLPLVTTSPQSQTVCSGEQVTFTAEATGTDVTYTWWRDTGDGNYSQLTQPNANPDYVFGVGLSFNGYKYKCIAQSGNCSTSTAESFEATLTVHETTIAAVSEQNLSICAGETASFSITMSNEEGLSFQWSDGNGILADGDLYAGVTTSTLAIGDVLTTPINNYTVSITGDCGSTSASFQLLVYGIEKPEITQNLSDPGNPSLQVTNSFALGVDNFEWFLNGNSYQNTSSSPILTLTEAGSYTVEATRNNCTHPESAASVIIVTGFENSLVASKVNYYPNPVSNTLTLNMGNDFNLEKGAEIRIINVNGREVFKRDYSSLPSRKTEIDMSGYESGIYLIRVINGDKMSQYKIRKQ